MAAVQRRVNSDESATPQHEKTPAQPDPSELLVESIKGVSKKIATSLRRLGIETIRDFLEHYPHRYLDLRTLKNIADIKIGEEVTVRGIVKNISKRVGKKGTHILTISISDSTGYIYGIWFNQNFIANRLKEGIEVAFSGKVEWRFQKLQILNPFYDILSERDDLETVHTSRIIPFHPATQSLSATWIRRLIKNALEQFASGLPDALPHALRKKYNLPSKELALKQIHFPDSWELLEKARKRLIFEELFLLQIGLTLRKKKLSEGVVGISHHVSGKLLEPFYRLLPFRLTGDQRKVLREILHDMKKPQPMHRLLQGEVGSGKTVIALATMLMALEGGYQAALMAPTEVLAEQHYLKLKEILKKLKVRVALLLGSQKETQKNEIQKEIQNNRIDIVIGTHSLIQESVSFANLGVIVIDEQHRFGVRQRLSLREKGEYPDVLVMTATPIPRTLSLTLYGDLDLSILRELPEGRNIYKQIRTQLVPLSAEKKRASVYEFIKRQVREGHQGYIVCPLIDESDRIAVKSVLKEAEILQNKIFPDLKVGLLHSKLTSAEKEEVMTRFRQGALDLLIATTVIEVGIDVPNATIMLVEHAERFGLSQLHQLRGRIGRGQFPSYCFLFADLSTTEAQARMKAILATNDGFELAEADLQIRGEGQIFGSRQSGLTDLKLAKLTKHEKILNLARLEALKIIKKDPDLSHPQNKILFSELKKKFVRSREWLFSG